MTDGKSDLRSPPIGGAWLECLLRCPGLSLDDVASAIALCQRHGFQLRREESLLAYGRDPTTPHLRGSPGAIRSFVDGARQRDSAHVIVNFEGNLVDVPTTLTLIPEFSIGVAGISITEDVLWAYSGDPDNDADFDRLLAFADCCADLAELFEAEDGVLGTEHWHADELVGADAEKLDLLRPEELFSRKNLQELFDWYINVYTKRWDR